MTFCCVFLVDKGPREESNTSKIGPSSIRSETPLMAFEAGRADDGLTLNAGMVALRFVRGSGPVLLRNPITL